MTAPRIVIVGGGHAAAQLCASLVETAPDAKVTVVSREHLLPYHRPPLSKTFLKSVDENPHPHRGADWYATHGIDVRLETTAVSIDRERRELVTDPGPALAYDRLVLATGTRPRALDAIDRPYPNLLMLRSLRDAEQLRERLLAPARGRVAIIGGGFIGLEVAATARQLGWEVVVIETAPRLLGRSASAMLADHVVDHHRGNGIDIRLASRIDGIETRSAPDGPAPGEATARHRDAPDDEANDEANDERIVAVTIDGDSIPVDLVLVGIGAEPETALARAAGLEVANGIVVDDRMVTSDPSILAIGDCTDFPLEGRRTRLESVQNANDQARTAALTLAGGSGRYRPTPFFWSDQGGMRLQMVGLWRPGLESHRRAGPTANAFSLFHYDGDTLVCVETVNAPIDHLAARKLIEKGLSPAPAVVTDPTVALKSLA